MAIVVLPCMISHHPEVMLSVLVAIFHFYEISSQARLLRQRYVPLIVPLGIAAVVAVHIRWPRLLRSRSLSVRRTHWRPALIGSVREVHQLILRLVRPARDHLCSFPSSAPDRPRSANATQRRKDRDERVTS